MVLLPGETAPSTEAAKVLQIESSTDSDAREALARAEALRALGRKASLHEAIDHYDKAALLWTSIADFANASEARLKSGDVYFLLSEYKQALERYENAEALAEKSGDWTAHARALSQIGRVQSYLGNNTSAEKQLTKALHAFKQHGGTTTDAYGEVLSNLAEVTYSKGNFVKALKQLNTALEVLRSDRKSEAKAHLLKGYILGSIGVSEKALIELSRARELYRQANDKRGEAVALTAMGLRYSFNRDEIRAIEMHNNARQVLRDFGDQHGEAAALNAIGEAYKNLNEYSTALFYYQSALELFQNIDSLDGASGSSCAIGETHARSKNPEQALTSYERCLELSLTAGNRRIAAYARKGIADVYATQGRHEVALKQYQNIQGSHKSINDLRGQAIALNDQGDVFLRSGDKQKALEVYHQASSLTEKIDDKGVLLSTLYNLARANHAVGSHDTALSIIKQSLDVIESARQNLGSPDFRVSYFSGVKKHYDLCIDIFMQLDRLQPGQGFAAEAFFVSEKSRARSLIDLLSESRANLREGAAKELLDSERTLKGLLQSHAEYQLNSSLSGNESTEIAEVNADIADLKSRYQAVQAQLRERNPRLFAFEQFAPVDLKHIQSELRGSNTMLLEYSLGDERSYLWAVTANAIHSYELPAGSEIEDLARDVYKLITARQEGDGEATEDYAAKIEMADNLYSEKASHLSRILLGPVADRLGSHTLLVVTEGALQYIPFHALPLPSPPTAGPSDTSKTLLVETNEVVALPSASTLIAIRGAENERRSHGKLLAIIADPVVSTSDDRVQTEARSTATSSADEDANQFKQQTIENLNLTRLVHASEEADAISAMAPWGTTLVAKGFEASRERALSPEVSRAQIVHFATHGVLNTKRPELSGIVLTMTDVNGKKTNGIMLLPDIYGLDLSAELTVLSACQTALGKDMKGEGLVGLNHSFLSAGSKSVVASLWKVDDRATAVFMENFYDGLIQKGMTPPAALRSAKLKMMDDKQWSAPYYWAGFVLHGEYMNRISVDRRPWLRAGLVLLSSAILITAGLIVFQKRKRKISPSQST